MWMPLSASSVIGDCCRLFDVAHQSSADMLVEQAMAVLNVELMMSGVCVAGGQAVTAPTSHSWQGTLYGC